ncbi:hypothetical protein TorRG33x02_284590, partial [Trema orientale]
MEGSRAHGSVWKGQELTARDDNLPIGMEGSRAHGSGYDVIGAHGLGTNMAVLQLGAHGLVREDARVSSLAEHGLHGPIQATARASDFEVQHAAKISDRLGLGIAKRGSATIGGDHGPAATAFKGGDGEHQTAVRVPGGGVHQSAVIGGGDHQVAARVPGDGAQHTADRTLRFGDHHSAARVFYDGDHQSAAKTFGLGSAKRGYTTTSMVGVNRAGHESAGPLFAQ